MIGSLNVRGQTTFTEIKREEIAHIISGRNIDILALQEVNMETISLGKIKYLAQYYDFFLTGSNKS